MTREQQPTGNEILEMQARLATNLGVERRVLDLFTWKVENWKVLDLLTSNQGIVITQDELLATVGMEADSEGLGWFKQKLMTIRKGLRKMDTQVGVYTVDLTRRPGGYLAYPIVEDEVMIQPGKLAGGSWRELESYINLNWVEQISNERIRTTVDQVVKSIRLPAIGQGWRVDKLTPQQLNVLELILRSFISVDPSITHQEIAWPDLLESAKKLSGEEMSLVQIRVIVKEMEPWFERTNLWCMADSGKGGKINVFLFDK